MEVTVGITLLAIPTLGLLGFPKVVLPFGVAARPEIMGGTNNPQHAPNPNVYGAGGGGAFYRTSGSWGNSGPGYQGCVIVEEYA
jgi:hypothetical protein